MVQKKKEQAPIKANQTKKAAVKNKLAKKEPVKKYKPEKIVESKKKTNLEPKQNTGFPIVGLGASAGGLEALETFFSNMPSDSGIAFVIIQHLSPNHKSIMGALLSKCTQMEVHDLNDGIKIQPNNVYLNPPNKNVAIINGKIQLMIPIKTSRINLPIDYFFRSMSEDLGEKAICIILSGTATDGTLGLRAIKGEGGMAMVQDPDSAKYDGMPRSAIATGIVDFILPVEKLPTALIKFVKAPYISAPVKIETPDSQFSNYVQKVFALIRTATGHDLSHYKQTTIRRRIERRMAVHQVETISNYVEFLQRTPAEVTILFKDMLIGVTNFFRDPEAFKILEEKVIPTLLEKRLANSTIRVWTIGCSTGEEAYSLAILFSEAMEKLKLNMTIQAFASDIDAHAIDHARMGIYPDSIAADVSSERLNKYFVKEDTTYRVKKQIREMIVFAVQNVIKDPPFSKMDLVSCRNLLIYMDAHLQKKVLPLAHYTLNPEGVLFLGTSESIGEFTGLFHPIDNKWKIFNRKNFYVEKRVDHPTTPLYKDLAGINFQENKPSSKLDIHTLAERVILDTYAPPGVLVNEKHEIVHFMGKTDKYLETPVGKASFNILQMAREGLRFKLTTALHSAMRQKQISEIKGLRIKYNGGFQIIDLTVRPLLELAESQNFMLVMFDDKTPSDKMSQKKGKKTSNKDSDPTVVSLERELESTKEHLQVTIEEMETSNEELKSTNEELQSVNEELQSTNEELETSKEELQSTNEELITVNTELQNKVDELSQANNDINNLLASTDIGTIFLDTSLYIKRFTPAMTNIFNLKSSDLDRPISDITSKIRYKDIKEDGKEVLRTLIQKDVNVQDNKGNWFAMRISPYRTIENVIDGIVITFVDITKIRIAEEALQVSEERFRSIFEQTSESIVLIDSKTGAFIEFNQRAYEDMGYTSEEFTKLTPFDFEADTSSKGMTGHFKAVLDKGFEVFETKQKTKKGKVINTQVNSKVITIHGEKFIQSLWWRY